MRAQSTAFAAAGVVALMLVGACSSSPARSLNPATTASTAATTASAGTPGLGYTTPPSARVQPLPSATPASDRFTDPYVNALEDFLAAYSRADRAGDPTYPDLSRYAQGAALAWATNQVADHVKLGIAHRGYFEGRTVLYRRIDSSTYAVRQCLNWATWPVVNRATGASLQRFPAWSQSARGRVQRSPDGWKLVSFTVQAGAC